MKRIKNWLTKRKKGRRDVALEALSMSLKTTDAHIVALARLGFIKPEDLAREARNNKANAEYLLRMIEERETKRKERLQDMAENRREGDPEYEK
jgi:hypothetical protein